MKKERKKLFGTLMALFVLLVLVILLLCFLVIAVLLFVLMRAGIFSLNVNPGQGMPPAALWVLFFLLASLVISFLIILLVFFLPMRWLNTLMTGLRNLAQGDFSSRINVGSVPLAKNVAASFNTLAEELEGTEMLRSDFVNNFSHEIKTPIVSIRGFARLLQQEDLTPKQQEYADIIAEESDRVSGMTQKVLDLAKLENQTILTDTEEYNLSEQLRRCCLLLIHQAEKKQVELDADFPEVKITANLSLLQEVWMNLLDNAVKFAPQGSTVEIRIAERKDGETVTISNESEPLPEAAMRRIFQKFYQAESSHSNEGTGIGLSIVKRIVELHGGTATAVWDRGVFSMQIFLPKS